MRPVPLSRLLAVLVLVSAPFPALAQPPGPGVPDREKAAYDYALPRVFAVRTDKGSGTAVLLKVEGGVGYFASCYHVLYQTTKVAIYPSAVSGALVADQSAVKVLPLRARDLVLLKVQLPPKHNFKAIDPNALADDNDAAPFGGYVFGMAAVAKRQMFVTGVRIQQKEYADQLRDVVDPLWPADQPRLQLRQLGKEMTYAGMSGGLVVDEDRRFAGLLLGRMPEPNAIPVMITAAQVKELLDSSEKATWMSYAEKVFADPPPYKKEVLQRMLAPWRVSEIGWDTYEAWVRAFDAEPLRFLEAFQEVRLALGELQSYSRDEAGQNSDEVRIRVGGGERLLLNGVEWKPDQPAKLQRGENLLIVTRPPTAPTGRVDLTDLLLPDSLDVTLLLGPKQEPVFQLKRSLPRIIQGYSVYVTITNGPPDEGVGYAARLAVPLDYIEEVINLTPFKLPFGDRDRRSGSEFRGLAQPLGDRPVRLTYVSPQMLDVSANIGIDVTEARANFAGLRLTGKPSSSAIRMTGRVQFPASPRSLFFVCARAMAAAGDGKQFVLPVLGDELTVDASGLVRELLVCYTNTRLLRPGNPRTPGSEDIHEFLKSGGLASGDKTWRFDPLQVQLVRDDRQGSDKVWAVVTFRLLENGKPVPVPSSPPLLPPPAARDGLAAEFVAAAVPPASVAALHPSVVGPTGLPRGLGATEAGPFDLRLVVGRPKAEVRKSITLSENAVELADQLGRAVTSGVAQTKVTGEVSWGGLKSGDLDAEKIRLSVSYAPGAGQPQAEGEVAVGKATIKTDLATFTLSDIRGSFTLTVDPNSAERAVQFRIKIAGGTVALGKKAAQPLPRFGFDVWVSRDGKKVGNNFADSFFRGQDK